MFLLIISREIETGLTDILDANQSTQQLAKNNTNDSKARDTNSLILDSWIQFLGIARLYDDSIILNLNRNDKRPLMI